MYYCSQPATCKEFVATTTVTSNDALSTLEIRFFDESRMISGYTSSIHDGRGLSLCIRLQALDLIAYSILTVKRYQIPGILSMYVVFILDQLGTSFIKAWR
jgi:hypothetical protein